VEGQKKMSNTNLWSLIAMLSLFDDAELICDADQGSVSFNLDQPKGNVVPVL